MKAWQTRLSEIYALRRPSADADGQPAASPPEPTAPERINDAQPTPPAVMRPTVRLLGRRTGRLAALVVTSDGQTLVAAHEDGRIRLIRVATGRLLHEWSLQAEPHAVALSADGRWLAVGVAAPPQAGAAADVRLYDLRHGVSAHTITIPCHGPLPAGGPRIDALAFHPDEPVLAIASAASLGLWDVWSGHARQQLRGHTGTVTRLAFHPDGHRLASTDDEGTLHVWATGGGAPLHSVHQQGPIRQLAISSDGNWLAWGTADGSVLVSAWSPAPLQRVRQLEGQSAGITGLAFGAGSLVIAKVSADGSAMLRLWDTAEGRLAQSWPLAELMPTCLALSADGRWAAVGGGDGGAALLALGTGELLRRVAGDAPAITALALSPDQQWLVSGSADGQVTMWDPRNGRALREMRVHQQAVVAAAFSADGHWWASGAADGTVLLWGRGKPHPLHARPGLRRLAFCPQNRWLALAGDDGAVQLLPLREPLPKQAPVAQRAGTPVVELCFSTHGQLLAWACEDGQVTCWDPVNRQVRSSHRLPVTGVQALAWSDDLRWLAAASGSRLLLWDLLTDRAVWEQRLAPSSRVTRLLFDADGTVLHAGSDGGMQTDWAVASGRLLCSRTGAPAQAMHECLGLLYPSHALHDEPLADGAIRLLVE